MLKNIFLTSIEDVDLIFYSSFSPNLPIEKGELAIIQSSETSKISRNEFINCALGAIGADALNSLAFSGASSWSIGAMTTAFTGVAKRFLGPIGVGIAVISFGLCMNEAYQN
ncbi:hypothetical protein G6N05_13650 [Flavobacterium sp. F372]|uniref:Uncharacterized protein n=1 Tax=Flavobacterium bernardetii TaxID=2813823 RepID=A0ABR7J1F0_9FLAO|nr:hypothetical protein [Flavobacterium bernardetii]MBC5835896.1 hypothetical protein [Flavobacterium bernardetii]NHF71158.1 hypothetical protein [Flavobacterium bernardetii]